MLKFVPVVMHPSLTWDLLGIKDPVDQELTSGLIDQFPDDLCQHAFDAD